MTEEKIVPKIVPGKKGNTKQSSPAKKWCFTLNNYTDEDEKYLVPELLNEIGTKWQFGKETAPTSGTPHLQGWVHLKKKQRITGLKKYDNRIHWERQKAKDDLKAIDYTSKEDTNAKTTIRRRTLGTYSEITWKDWQKEIIDICETKPDNRTVHWYWEKGGNTGKSFLTKYLVSTYNAMIVNGKVADIAHQVGKRCEDDIAIDVVIFDMPRCSKGLLSYQAIEMLKNGLIYSGKYEGGQYIFDPPHVIIFANEAPEKKMLSADRWHIVKIPNKLVETEGYDSDED